jgi:hypothetical protein
LRRVREIKMGNKKLYVVSSVHMGKDNRVNNLYKVAQVGEIRLKVLEALARQIRSGAFFCDGTFKSDARDFNKLIRHTISPEKLNEAAFNAYHKGDYEAYDQLRLVELFKVLRGEVCKFVWKATERGNPHKISYNAYKEVAEKGGYDIHKRMSSPEKVVLAKRIVRDINIRAVQIRDKRIVNNIVRNGLGENLLYVGKNHKLEELASLGLEWYRIDVDSHKGKYRVYGRLPSAFMNNVNKSLSRLYLTIEQKLEYV